MPPLAPEQWGRVKRVLQAALAHRDEALDAFLARECADEFDVRRAVESLLGAHGEVGRFAEAPAPLARPAIGSDVVRAAASLVAGARLGPYEVASPIGAGAMGEVYRARDVRLGREVAIKVLPRAVASDAVRVARFEQEARAASALNHPNIVAVYDTGWHEGLPFIVTELLEGELLADRVARGPLPVRDAVECALQIAHGLVAAHERGIVHRDLKPANLFLTRQGHLKIIDFGVAKLPHRSGQMSSCDRATLCATMPGLVLGTVGYMSPEQVRAGPVDIRSDQFSLGCVLYELLAGRPPFERATSAQILAAVLEDQPPPLAEVTRHVPLAVTRVVERCLAKAPERRFRSTRELKRALELALGQLSERGPKLATARVGAAARPGLAMMFGAALMAGCVAAEWWTRQVRSPVPAGPSVTPERRSATSRGRTRTFLRAVRSLAVASIGRARSPGFTRDGHGNGPQMDAVAPSCAADATVRHGPHGRELPRRGGPVSPGRAAHRAAASQDAGTGRPGPS